MRRRQSGGFWGVEMKTLIYITLKYWKKHIKSALAVLFSGVLLTAVIFVTLMSMREETVRSRHKIYDTYGHYDVLIANSDDEILAKATKGKWGYNYGVMYVLGEMGTADSRFFYGTIEDEHDLWHVPLDEGRMPETADELAVDRAVLDTFYWVGKCGDTITLDGRTFTVVGIINEDYGRFREGSQIYEFPTYIENSPYKVPLIFVGKSDETPLYRMDLLSDIFNVWQSDEGLNQEFYEYEDYLTDAVGYETHWFALRCDETFLLLSGISQSARFFMLIAGIGAVISALSVFSILRSVFAERKSRIDILKRIGMKKSGVVKLHAVECAIFAVIQIILGIALGLAAYQVIFLFKTNVLGEKPYSGLTDLAVAIKNTLDPFAFGALISAAIIVGAYVLNAVTMRIKLRVRDKNSEPRPLSKCFTRVFRQRAVTVTQTAALTLICFSVLTGYMYYTDNGKTHEGYAGYTPPSIYYTANDFNMEEYNIAEYYHCASPAVSSIGDGVQFPFINADHSAGIDDSVAGQLPEYALATGNLINTFISSEERNNSYINEIDTSADSFRQGLLVLSSEEYQNFFEKGQTGSKYLYLVNTRLAPVRTIESLSGNVREGEINIDKINSGEEILVIYQEKIPPFKVGDTVTINSAAATESGFGIGDLKSAEVRIGAILKTSRSEDGVKSATISSRQQDYNFLTTATGAEKMGLHCARYTEIYTSEPMDGGIIPSSAKMTMSSLEIMKREDLIRKAVQYAGSFLILLVMSLLGFAAYFNGIGMKIRMKSYDISVIRAIGAPVSELRKRLLTSSIRIPVISSVLAYVMAKLTQLQMMAANSIYSSVFEYLYMGSDGNFSFGYNASPDYQQPLDEKISEDTLSFLKHNFFLDRVMWQVNVEIPALILLIILCAVTFILTVIALRKFKGNIAGDLSEGRTRQ